jgi:tRNA pseudouridine13 synthase
LTSSLAPDSPPALRLPHGRIKARPEDFVVEEIPAYAPSGTGEHVHIRFTKTDRTTLDAVHAIARALGCDPREAGFAGMKDKRAVATQTVSVHAPRGTKATDIAERALSLDLQGIAVNGAVPHGNKLKPGHLVGNRFAIVVRDVPSGRLSEVSGALDRVAVEGVPNAFGAQRFGASGDNAARALAWLRGDERGPRDRKILRLLWSSLQSAVFNAVLDARVRDGTWATALEGDLLKLRASGGLFVCSDVQTDRQRALAGDVSPTGPIVGVHMRAAGGAPAELERRVADEILGPNVDLSRARALGEGSRRALRTWVDGLRCEYLGAEGVDRTPAETQTQAREHPDAIRRELGNGTACVRVLFVLPKGTYATTVLATAVAIDETRNQDRANQRDEEPPLEEDPDREPT